ncbi:MAG: hypothetical protein J6126_02705 [Clostridia bacterium]|nr:hypothetical protein [Clostridia bacterium]
MDEIFGYLANNPKYVIVLFVTLAVIIIAAVFGYIAKKYNFFKINDWFKKKEGEDNSEQPASAPIDDDARMPVKRITSAAGAEKGSDPAEELIGNEGDEESFGEETGDENPLANDCDIPKKDPTPEEAEESAFKDAMRMFSESDLTEKEEEPTEKIEIKREEKVEEPTETPPEKVEEEIPEGKWRIMPSGSTYVSELHSEEDELLLSLPHYSSLGGARGSIETVQKNVSSYNFSVSVDKDGKFRFKMYTSAGRLVCLGEPCETREECIEKIDLVKRIACRAEIVRG